MYSHFFRDSLKKIPAAGREDIQQNPLLQAYGAVHQPGRHDNGISGREFCAFPLHGVAEMPGEDIAALGVGMSVIRSDRAGFKGNLHGHELIIPGQHLLAGTAAELCSFVVLPDSKCIYSCKVAFTFAGDR